MAVTAYKTNRLPEQNATVYIVTGFTGQLKYWWDNSLVTPIMIIGWHGIVPSSTGPLTTHGSIRQYNSTENSKFHGYSAGATKLPSITALPTNF